MNVKKYVSSSSPITCVLVQEGFKRQAIFVDRKGLRYIMGIFKPPEGETISAFMGYDVLVDFPLNDLLKSNIVIAMGPGDADRIIKALELRHDPAGTSRGGEGEDA